MRQLSQTPRNIRRRALTARLADQREREEARNRRASSCDCMWGCRICNPEPFDPTNLYHH